MDQLNVREENELRKRLIISETLSSGRSSYMDELKPCKFKKGDILRNGWTSEANPTHLSVFVKCGKVGNQKTFDCIGYDGSIVHHCRDNNKLEIVGHMAEYDAFVDALRKLDRREKRE